MFHQTYKVNKLYILRSKFFTLFYFKPIICTLSYKEYISYILLQEIVYNFE